MYKWLLMINHNVEWLDEWMIVNDCTANCMGVWMIVDGLLLNGRVGEWLLMIILLIGWVGERRNGREVYFDWRWGWLLRGCLDQRVNGWVDK